MRDIIVIALLFCIFKYFNVEEDEKTTSIQKKGIKRFLSYIPALIAVSIIAMFVTNNLYYAPVSILSNSMNPTFGRGDVVVYSQIGKDQIKNLEKGDIIVHNKNGQIIIHRIVGIFMEENEHFFITKGDASNGQDIDLVSERNVLGKYETSIPKMGWPSI